MSDTAKLTKTRAVRLRAETDRLIETIAARKGKTASGLIRETLEAEFSTGSESPGQWLLRTARRPRDRQPDALFSAAYRQRHR